MSRSTAAAVLMTIVLLGACGDVVHLTVRPSSSAPATTAAAPPTVAVTSRPLPEPSIAPEPPLAAEPPVASEPDPEPPPPPAEPPPPPPPAPPTDAPSTPTAGEGVAPHLVGTEMEVLPTDEKVVALTFDAGANADGIPSILATLDAAGVRGTFFLTGAWVERYPELAAQIGSEYAVANHSFTHPAFTTLSDEQIRDEVTRTNDVILAATGQDTRPIFRFPLGDRDERTTRLVNELGYANIRWTVDTVGWKGTSGGMTAGLVQQRVLDGLQPGAIVMMHVGSHPQDGSTLDADALPAVIEALSAAGYRFVTLDEYL